MGANNLRRLDDEMVNRLKRRAVEDGMTEKTRAFLALSRKLRSQTSGLPQTPAHVLIRGDRDGGHGSA